MHRVLMPIQQTRAHGTLRRVGRMLVPSLLHRLHYRLLCAIMLLVFMQTALWWSLSLAVATPIARQQAVRALNDATLSAAARVDQSLNAMDATSLQIAVDAQVQDALRHEARTHSDAYAEHQSVDDVIARTLAWTDFPMQIGLRGDADVRYGANLAMDWHLGIDPHFLAAARENDGRSRVYWTAPYVSRNFNVVGQGHWIAAARSVPDQDPVQGTGTPIGTIVTELPVDQLGLQLPDPTAGGHVALALLTQTGAVITGGTYGIPGWHLVPDLPPPHDQLVDWRGTTYVVVSSHLQHAGWWVAGLIPWDDANAIVTQIEHTIGGIAVAEICLTIAFAWFISSWINRPLQRLLLGIRQVRAGNWAAYVPVTAPDEIGELSSSFNAMTEQIQATTASLREAQQRELTARLDLLSGQINAHFLFNALELIDCVAFKDGPEAVTRVVLALGQVLRYTLDARDGEATLADEVRQTENYLLIQSERFEDLLSFHIEVDPTLSAYLVPRFSLQPLVENAIKHGVDPAHGPCTIVVRAYAEGAEVYLVVEDDGVGMPPARVAALRASLRTDGATALGVGLLNVHRRLRLCFGTRAGLEIATPALGGTIVRLRMPRVSRKEEMGVPYARG